MDPQVLAACRQFEAVLLRPLLEPLRFGRVRLPAGLGGDDPQGLDEALDHEASSRGAAGDLMQSMFVEALSLALARAGGIGLARELSAMLAPRR